MPRLIITDPRERALVRFADALLMPARFRRPFRRKPHTPMRILCLRLERIGDLLMTIPAIAALHAAAPQASIDLVVGSWNRALAGSVPGVDRVETVDAEWLGRSSTSSGVARRADRPEATGIGAARLTLRAARWRSRKYDLAINFEPDIRSNLAIAFSGARWTAGFASGGGGPLLDTAIDFDVTAHTTDNALALVRAVVDGAEYPAGNPLAIGDASRAEAARLLATLNGSRLIGMHVSGGRAIKQWPESRFRDLAERIVRERGAAIVLTGTSEDRAQVDIVKAALPPERVLDLSGDIDLLTVTAVVERLNLVVTGDTGPMHLAHAVGTPVVAVFGPSDPARYAPRGSRDRVVRVDLPCSPCNRIRLPPARCTGHTPDCLAGVEVAQVLAAIDDTMGGGR